MYLEQACARLEERGVQVHFAKDAQAARELSLAILERRGARKVVKTKTMVSEEIELGHFLEKHGVESVETGGYDD